jgi:hypothetical protein
VDSVDSTANLAHELGDSKIATRSKKLTLRAGQATN